MPYAADLCNTWSDVRPVGGGVVHPGKVGAAIPGIVARAIVLYSALAVMLNDIDQPDPDSVHVLRRPICQISLDIGVVAKLDA